MKDNFKFKRKAEIIKFIDERNMIVKLEDGQELLANVSARQQYGNLKLKIGQRIIIIANPYEESRVKVHNDSWHIR